MVDVNRITGCLGAAWDSGEKGQCHWVGGMNIWWQREETLSLQLQGLEKGEESTETSEFGEREVHTQSVGSACSGYCSDQWSEESGGHVSFIY